MDGGRLRLTHQFDIPVCEPDGMHQRRRWTEQSTLIKYLDKALAMPFPGGESLRLGFQNVRLPHQMVLPGKVHRGAQKFGTASLRGGGAKSDADKSIWLVPALDRRRSQFHDPV